MAEQKPVTGKKMELLVYRGPKHHRYAWASVVIALLFTFGLFALLPFTEMLNLEASDIIELRDVDSLDLKLAPPKMEDKAPPKARPVRKQQNQQSQKPKLDMPESARRSFGGLSLSLDMGLSEFSGDFALSFATVPDNKLGRTRLAEPGKPIVFSLNEVDRKPRATLRSAPVIPYQARVKNIEGYVKLIYVVTSEGGVTDISIHEAVPEKIFDEAAKDAVSRWRFEPALKDGEPVAVKVMSRLLFELK